MSKILTTPFLIISVSSPGPHRSQVRCCDMPGGCKGRQRRLAKERQRPKTAITKCTAPGSDWVVPSFLKTFLGSLALFEAMIEADQNVGLAAQPLTLLKFGKNVAPTSHQQNWPMRA